ncbi:MAG: hypothetical protein ACTTH5_03460 [Wolinella sp.]
MKLLLVNKNPIVRKLFKLSSEKAGIEFFETETLEHLSDLSVDLVFVDDESLDGSGVFERLQEGLPQAKYGLLHAKNKERDARFALFVQKPFLPTDLVDLFKSEMGNSAQEFFQHDSPKDNEISGIGEPVGDMMPTEGIPAKEEESGGEKSDVAENGPSKEEFNLDISNASIGDDWALTLGENTASLPDAIEPRREKELSDIDLGSDLLELDLPIHEEMTLAQPQQEVQVAQEPSEILETMETPQPQEIQEQAQEAEGLQGEADVGVPDMLDTLPDALEEGILGEFTDEVAQDMSDMSGGSASVIEDTEMGLGLADLPSEVQSEVAEELDLEEFSSELEGELEPEDSEKIFEEKSEEIPKEEREEEPKELASLESPSLEETQDDPMDSALDLEEDSLDSSTLSEDLGDFSLEENTLSKDISNEDISPNLDDVPSEMPGAEALEQESLEEEMSEVADSEPEELMDMPSELAQEGGILDASDLQEVKNLLEDDEATDDETAMSPCEEANMNDIKIESSELAALTEEALSEALGEELPPKPKEEIFDFGKESSDMPSEDMASVSKDFEEAHEEPCDMGEKSHEEGLATESTPSSPASIPANDALKSLQGLSIPALRELFDGAELTVSISFPKNKK